MSDLQKLSYEQQISVLTTPFFVPATENPEMETSFQSDEICETFFRLSRNIKYKLPLPDTSQKIQAIGQKYGFELLRLANITRLIREYYFGEIRFENFATEIEKRMNVSLLTAQEITRYIKSEIIDWDPWAEYAAKLPKHSVREIVAEFPKLAEMEITAGYVELKGNEELLDPTIKNWIHDYILHVGQAQHPQMERTQYLFHSENTKDLSSPDREKLGIILKSFDENIPLPVDEENGEIVFDGLMSKPTLSAGRQNPQLVPKPSFVPPSGTTAGKQESFIRPYNPIPARNASPARSAASAAGWRSDAGGQEPPKQTPRPAPMPQNFVMTKPAPQQAEEFAHPNFATQPNRQISPEINKFFNAPETLEIPEIKIHSMTEHNEPKIAPVSMAQRPVPTSLPPLRPAMRDTSPRAGEEEKKSARPQHRIIEPFSERFGEPRIDGNIVDLSSIKE